MLLENNVLNDLPGLEDTQGLENYIQQQNQPAPPAANIPTYQQPNVVNNNFGQNASQSAPQGQPQVDPRIAELQQQNQLLQQQMQMQQAQQAQYVQQMQMQQQAQQQQALSPRAQQAVNNLLAKGVSPEYINNYLNNLRQGGATQANAALQQQINELQQQMQEKEYFEQQEQFVNKMSQFGNTLGLTEQDLVTFGTKAYNEFGIDLTKVQDYTPVFKMIYPEQYAIRSARMQQQSSSQIFGGASINAHNSQNSQRQEQMADAYVEDFLSRAMPNQFASNKNFK